MRAGAESDMIRNTVSIESLDVETIWIAPDVLVAVCRNVPGDNLISPADLLASYPRIASRRPADMEKRGGPSESFLDSAFEEILVSQQLSLLVREE